MKSRDPLLLIVVVLAAWQALYFTPATSRSRRRCHVSQSRGTLQNPRFYPHLYETASCIRARIRHRGAGRARHRIRRWGPMRCRAKWAEPILVALIRSPKVTLYPIILLVFGIGMPAKVAFGAIQGIVPVALFTMNAIRT